MGRAARGGRAALSLSLLAVALLVVAPATARAATVTNAWSARIGSGGANGTATLHLYTTGKGSLALKLAKLPAATSLPVTINKGTCSAVGTVLVTLPAIKTSSAGIAARTSSLTASQATSITNATTGTGKIAVRVGTGKTAKCGPLAPLPVQPYVAATISVGRHPHMAADAPSGVWVTSYWDNTLSRIDPATNSVLQTLSLALAGNAGPDAIAYGDGSLWVTVIDADANGNPLAGSVLRVDPASGQVQATIAVGRTPYAIAVTPTAVWVPAYDDNSLSRIDPATNAVVATIPVCANPGGVSASFGAVWTSCDDGSLARIDPATNAVVTTIQTQTTGGFVVASDTAIWMTNHGHQNTPDGSVTRIDPATNAVVANVVVGFNPQELAYGGGSLWIGMYGEPTVVRVSTSTNAVLARITVAAPVWAIAATDRSVWAVQNLQAPDANTPPPAGTVTRINYSGVTQGPMAASPPATPTPSPTPSPSASPVAPTTSPPAGGTLWVGPYFMLAAPAGWSVSPSADGTAVMFHGPGVAVIVAQSMQSGLTLEGLTAQVIANLRPIAGDPEQTEPITMDGEPGRLLTYHWSLAGTSRYQLEAICERNGRGYEVNFNDVPGTESAERALFLSVVASFAFLSAGG